jgi:glutamate racemase
MDNRPVGIFDSGLGGLTSLRELRKILPNESIIYFGDTGRNPYGTRPVEQLRRMAQEDMELLEKLGAKAIIAACGTVSSTAPDVLAAFRLSTFNVIDESVRVMAEMPGDAPFGVIATDASIRSGAYKRRLNEICPGREVIDIACQDFVRLVEEGHTADDDPLLDEAVERYLAPMREKHVCALLLGCTHFDFAAGAISRYLGADVVLVSAGGSAAHSMKRYLEENDMLGSDGSELFYSSGSGTDFAVHARNLLGRDIGIVEKAYAGREEPTKT